MKTIYLHIGTHKTASTALQTFFWKNRELLLQEDIQPINAIEGHKFYSCFLWHHPWRAFLNAETDRTQWTEAFLEKLQNSNADKILISSEFFSVLNKDLIGKLRHLFRSYHVKIICYVRRQDLWLESFYQEIVKAEPVFSPPFDRWLELLPPFPTSICNSYDMLKNWAEIFGKENLTVRPFEKQQLKNGDVFDDFLSLLGLELTDNYQPPESDNLNISLSPTMVEFIRLAKQIPVESRDTQIKAPIPKYISRKLIGLAPESAKIPKGQRCPFLSDERRISVLRKYEQNNQKIAREFLSRDSGILFYDPLPNDESHESFKPHDLDFRNATTALTEMLHTLNQSIENLESKQHSHNKRLTELQRPVRTKIKNLIKRSMPSKMYSSLVGAWNRVHRNGNAPSKMENQQTNPLEIK